MPQHRIFDYFFNTMRRRTNVYCSLLFFCIKSPAQDGHGSVNSIVERTADSAPCVAQGHRMPNSPPALPRLYLHAGVTCAYACAAALHSGLPAATARLLLLSVAFKAALLPSLGRDDAFLTAIILSYPRGMRSNGRTMFVACISRAPVCAAPCRGTFRR